MVDEEGFLADWFGSVYGVLDRHVKEVEYPSHEQEKSGQVISPKVLVDVLVHKPIHAGDQKWRDHDYVGDDPELVREVVVVC